MFSAAEDFDDLWSVFIRLAAKLGNASPTLMIIVHIIWDSCGEIATIPKGVSKIAANVRRAPPPQKEDISSLTAGTQKIRLTVISYITVSFEMVAARYFVSLRQERGSRMMAMARERHQSDLHDVLRLRNH